MKIKIVHIVTGLGPGGAENMLYKLLKNMDQSKYDLKVISLIDGGMYGEKIEKLDIPVYRLGMKRGIPSLKALFQAVKISRGAHIIQTWMYHADLFGSIVKRLARVPKLIWGIHHSNLDTDKNKKSTVAIAKINAKISKYTNVIISCSEKAKAVHSSIGYKEDKITVIPNGFNMDVFFKVDNAKQILLKELKIHECKNVISHVARWERLKDHNNFFAAVKQVIEESPDTIAILCGHGIEESNLELMKLINKYNIQDQIYLLGLRDDVPSIMSASDVFVSSSSGEGFPNVIGEAMACETSCVVTDVGDSALIVGNCGEVVPSKEPNKLAKGILKALSMSNEEKIIMGRKSREYVLMNFSIEEVSKQYQKLYK